MGRVIPVAIAMLILLAACASGPPAIRRGDKADRIEIMEVKNLAGVSLKIPSIYFGDGLVAGKALTAEKLDLRLLSRAGLYAYLKRREYSAALSDPASESMSPQYEVHAAVTHFNLDALRATGRITLAMHLMLVSCARQEVVMEADCAEDFQLFDTAPDTAGALGGERFIEERLKAFTEQLATSLLQKCGL